jgi:hypothetical protein
VKSGEDSAGTHRRERSVDCSVSAFSRLLLRTGRSSGLILGGGELDGSREATRPVQ